MQQWTYERIAPDEADRLPACRYHRFGGWLIVLLVMLLVQASSGFSMLMKLVVFTFSGGVTMLDGTLQTGFLALYGALYLVPLLLIVATLLLLFRRKYAFRIVLIVYLTMQIAALVLSLIGDGGRTPIPFVVAMLAYGAWVIYAFCSDRARVYCNRTPKRPVPMPAEAEADEDATAFGGARYRFLSAPAGRRAHARNRREKSPAQN